MKAPFRVPTSTRTWLIPSPSRLERPTPGPTRRPGASAFAPLPRRLTGRGLAYTPDPGRARHVTPLTVFRPGRRVPRSPRRSWRNTMGTITTRDGTEIYYKDWGSGRPVVFSHGWPLTADAWEDQMFYLASRSEEHTSELQS